MARPGKKDASLSYSLVKNVCKNVPVIILESYEALERLNLVQKGLHKKQIMGGKLLLYCASGGNDAIQNCLFRQIINAEQAL